MAILSSTGISGFLSSAKATGKQILNKAGKLIPEYIEDFVSGFAGHGWKIWNYHSELDSEDRELRKYKLEIDSITVRESMTVFELLIQKIRAVKGALSITQASGRVATAVYDEETNEWLLTVEDEMSFVAHDIIRCQSLENGTLRGYWVEISEIRKIEGIDTVVIPVSEFIGSIVYDKENGNAECVDRALTGMITPVVGDEIIQFGNSKLTNRQSAVYIHADENGQPAIDILFGVSTRSFAGCVKTRVGGDIPGGDGAKGFYCENGMIKCVDDTGSLIYEFKPDGSFSLGKRRIVYDTKEDKLKFGAGVTLTWDNIADDAKDNLKGDKGDPGDDAVTYEIMTPVSVIHNRSKYGPYPSEMKFSVRKTIGSTFVDITTDAAMVFERLTLKYLIPMAEGYGQDYEPWSIDEVMSSQYFQDGIKLRLLKGNFVISQKELPEVTDGMDGTSIEFIYLLASKYATEGTPPTPESNQYDKYIPKGWTDKPQGVTEMYPHEWVSIRTKKNNSWSVFSTPALWSNWGERGTDGDGCEYIYKQTFEFVSPECPTGISQADDYVPEGWTGDPQGVSESLPYEWVCIRKSKNGIWKEFSTPVLWAKFGKDGQAGSDGTQGLPGLTIIRSEWRQGVEYRNDEEQEGGIRYLSIVLVRDRIAATGWRPYKCLKTHNSDLSNAPGNITYWKELAQNIPSIFTPLIIADNAKLDFMSGNEIRILDANDKVTAGISGSGSGDTGIRFYAGSDNPQNAPFRVNEKGEMVTENADIKGRVEADEGGFGGFEIDGFNLKNKADKDALIQISRTDELGTVREAILGNIVPGSAGFGYSSSFRSEGKSRNIAISVVAKGCTNKHGVFGGYDNLAILAYGGVDWKISEGDHWNMPGFLLGMSVAINSNGAPTIEHSFGNGLTQLTVSVVYNPSLRVNITHNIGHRQYFVQIVPYTPTYQGGWWPMTANLFSKDETSLSVEFRNDSAGIELPSRFDIMFLGRNML